MNGAEYKNRPKHIWSIAFRQRHKDNYVKEKKKVISSNGAGTNGDSYAKRTSIYTSYHIKHFQNNHQA